MMAHIAQDQEMIQAFMDNIDLHIKTAQSVLGIADPTKNDRTLAKALNFGLIYGCGPDTLREQLACNWGIILTVDECARYKRKFFNTYWGIEAYLEQCKKKEDYAWRSVMGRRRLGMGKVYNEKTRRMQNQFNRWSNTPVQGNSADGAKIALATVYKRRKEIPGMRLLLMCHDELVLSVPKPLAFQAGPWLQKIMVDSMQPLLGSVPCSVDYSIGDTWKC
jgi:DNA polymerase I-like protein with 3'-5' exonuclease and polymerase domains